MADLISDNLSMTFTTPKGDAVHALKDVSFTLKEGEILSVLGPSGCGKTTLLRLIAGFEQPNQGEILLFGDHLEGLEPYQRPVNTVFQSYSLFPHMSIAENIGFGLKMQGKSQTEISNTVSEMLELVKMVEYGDRMPNQLSGGQQQRIALARALAPRPKVLLLDEPLSALDLKLRQAMRHELKRLQRDTGITFVFVTHDQEEAMSMSDRIAVMAQGSIQQLDAPETIYERPCNEFVANFIGDVNLIEASVSEFHPGELVCQWAKSRIVAANSATTADLSSENKVRLAVRPEKIRLVKKDQGHANANVLESMYMGTDRYITVACDHGEDLEIRVQNSDVSGEVFREGDTVGILIPELSAVALTDQKSGTP